VNFSLNLKYKSSILSFIALVFCILHTEKINAQSAISDSISTVQKDSLNKPALESSDTTHNQQVITSGYDITGDTLRKSSDTLSLPPKKDIETAIIYSCRDSIRMNVAEKKVYLFGDSKVVYGTRTITAERMEIDWSKNEVAAYGTVDTITGRPIGEPVVHEGSEVYTCEFMRYNIKTGKGFIKGIVTKQGDGFVHGGPVKKMPEAVYINHAVYTTCNLPHPHFSINASKLKIIPSDKIVSGPFHIQIMHIPLPIGFPLGFFPASKRAKSGFIIPSPGQQASRGFFLSQGGYYWAVNNYLGIQFMGDIYSNGSFNTSLSGNYIKRYTNQGNISLSYSQLKTGFDPGGVQQQLYKVLWTHRTLSKKGSNLTANVNISSSNYYSKLSYNTTTNTQGAFNSGITYNKTFRNTPFNMSVSLNQNQNTTSKLMQVTAPNISLNMNRVYPFRSNRGGSTKWYEQIGVSYQGQSQYQLSNNVHRNGDVYHDTILTPNASNYNLMLQNGQWGAMHSIPISTTFKLLKFLNLNPTLTYQQWWYMKQLEYSTYTTTNATNGATSTNAKITDTLKGFNVLQNFNFSISLTTRVYGMYKIKNKVLKAIRHTMNPSITYSYAPNSSSNRSYFQTFPGQIMSSDNKPTPYSTHSGFLYGGGPASFLTNQVSFSINNVLEGKVRNRKDTTGENALKKIKLLDNFQLSGAYNFGADSLRLSNINLSTNSRFFNKIDFRFVSSFDPYLWVVDSITTGGIVVQRHVNKFVFDQHGAEKKLATLNMYNLSLSTSLNPQARNSPMQPLPQNPNQNGNMMNNSLTYLSPYVDFNLPWNLSLGYVLSYQKTGFAPSYYTQSLSVSGEVKLSDKWKVKFTSGYDFVHNSITNNTSIQIFRDLHCWQMNMSIIPYGTVQSFLFTLTAKSALLRDVKVNKRSSSYNSGY
jgi:hypothetical protein